VDVELRRIEDRWAFGAVAPFPVGEGIDGVVDEADELQSLPGELLQRGFDVGCLLNEGLLLGIAGCLPIGRDYTVRQDCRQEDSGFTRISP
jgi:hypothetical protein